MNFLRVIKCYKFTLSFILLAMYPSVLLAQTELSLTWLKPIESDQKMQGNTLVQGTALDLMQFVALQMEGITHKFEAYPIKRSWRLIQNSKKDNTVFCFWGADHKTEREQWGYFTQPTAVSLPLMVASRTGEFSGLDQNGSVSVTELLKKGYTTVLFEKVVNAWTKVVEEVANDSVVTISGLDKDLSDHTLLLIKRGRIDFGYVSYRAISNLRVAAQSQIDLHQIQELEGNIKKGDRLLCSKTPAGKRVVEMIDSALENIHSNKKLSLQMKRLVFETEGYPQRFWKSFDSHWRRAFLQN